MTPTFQSLWDTIKTFPIELKNWEDLRSNLVCTRTQRASFISLFFQSPSSFPFGHFQFFVDVIVASIVHKCAILAAAHEHLPPILSCSFRLICNAIFILWNREMAHGRPHNRRTHWIQMDIEPHSRPIPFNGHTVDVYATKRIFRKQYSYEFWTAK